MLAWQGLWHPRGLIAPHLRSGVKAGTIDVYSRQGAIPVDRSRIPHFYKMSVDERVAAVHERGLLSESDYQTLLSGKHTLQLSAADKMIENVIGVMGLPIGLGLNFLINEWAMVRR